MSTFAFTPSREAALQRLAAFAPNAGRAYAERRNADTGPRQRSNVSQLSPYLRHRMITEREVVASVVDVHGLAKAEKFVQEVLWRTYWKGWLELRPAIWNRYLAQLDHDRDTSVDLALLASAESGTTGIDGFDHWARELTDTGFLHNHARMWFASIWIFTLQLPWTLGADFFLRHLLDADPASNTLSWRWVAGLQTVGKTYLATSSNIERYTEGRFSPKNLATVAVPLVDAPNSVPSALAKLDDPEPDLPALLLVTPEDFHPESLFAVDPAIGSALVLSQRGYGVEQSRAFVSAAADDAAARIRTHYRCPVETIDTLDATDLLSAAAAANVRKIVTPATPVGPLADALRTATPILAQAGITVVQKRRSWDTRFWPHATKGFFPFKERIPALLREEGLPV